MTFDPAAATAAYMAQLSPAQHAQATAYTQGSHWILLWSWVAGTLVAWLILRTGLLTGLRDQLQRRSPRPTVVSFVLAMMFSLLDWLGTLPWAVYAEWWRQKSYGLNNQTGVAWLSESSAQAAIGAIETAIFFVLLYALIRRAPRSWWAWAGGLAAACFALILFVAPVFIEPLFNRFTPAPPGPIRDAVVDLARQNGVPFDKIYIYNGSKQSNRYTANVSGMFGSARIAMSDVMFRNGADIAEVRGVVGHEMGHYAHQHALWLTLAFGLSALAGLGLTARLFPMVSRWLHARGTRGIADPATLPVFTVITASLMLLATPLINAVTRTAESDADNYSLTHAEEPDGLSKALVKTIDYRASSPSRLEEVMFYDHPSVERRVRRAMNWKAEHPAEAAATALRDANFGTRSSAGAPPP
jgi:STE24 endopeptidase